MFKISQTSSVGHVAMACFFLDSLLQPPFTFTAPLSLQGNIHPVHELNYWKTFNGTSVDALEIALGTCNQQAPPF